MLANESDSAGVCLQSRSARPDSPLSRCSLAVLISIRRTVFKHHIMWKQCRAPSLGGGGQAWNVFILRASGRRACRRDRGHEEDKGAELEKIMEQISDQSRRIGGLRAPL